MKNKLIWILATMAAAILLVSFALLLLDCSTIESILGFSSWECRR